MDMNKIFSLPVTEDDVTCLCKTESSKDQKAAAVHAINMHDDLVECLSEWVVQHGCTCYHPACRSCRATEEANVILAKARLKPAVCEDGWHCDPKCPFLKDPSNDRLNGTCTKSGNELTWHDYYIAECVN